MLFIRAWRKMREDGGCRWVTRVCDRQVAAAGPVALGLVSCAGGSPELPAPGFTKPVGIGLVRPITSSMVRFRFVPVSNRFKFKIQI